MKLEDSTGWIWFFIDEYGDVDTEFFWLEQEEGVMPYSMEKTSWDVEYENSTPIRVRIVKIEN